MWTSPSVGYDLWMADGPRGTGPDVDGPPIGGPRIRFVNLGGDRMAEAFQAARGQPNWAVRIAVLTFLLIVGIPILLLLLVAGLAAAVVFAILSTLNWIFSGFRSTKPTDDGRRNVRIIDRD